MSLKNVVVVGGSGNLGPAIIKELLAAGFNVTVTVREESKATFDSAVKVARTDYSPDSIHNIFKDQDAVISTFGGEIIDKQRDLIDAAVKAGVKRFFPSEFGGDTTDPEATKLLPLFKQKQDIVGYLKDKESTGLSWTGIVSGPFFDWGIQVGFLDVDVKNQKATLWDGGNTKFATSNLSTIGKAVANIISKPDLLEATKNQYVAFESFTVSQKDILAAAEQISGKKYEVINKNSKEEIPKAQKAVQDGNPYAIYDVLKAALLGQRDAPPSANPLGGHWNEKLGLPKEDLKQTLKQLLSA